MEITLGEALLLSGLGMLVVFAVLVFLMLIINIMSAATKASAKNAPAREAKKAEKQAAKAARKGEVAPSTAPPVAANKATANGTFGELKLHDVPEATAAMVMAIVADKLETPLNELRFVSIEEIKE